jgi:hypothetical protein
MFATLTSENNTMVLVGIYDVVYDINKELLEQLPPSLPRPDQSHPPTKKTKIPLVMLISLILFRFFTGHRSYKEYYRYLKSHHEGINIGYLPTYRNFMKQVHKLAPYAATCLEMLCRQCKKGVLLQFVDSTKLKVCEIKREFTYKVAKGLATKSKSTMGWYFGFKLHLVVDIHGRILSCRITTATVDDRKGLALMWKELAGTIVADAGYLGSNWQQAAAKLHLHLMAAVKKVMKKLMSKFQHQLFIARQGIESVISVVKFRMGMENTLPRSIMGYFSHYLWCLMAYQLKRLGQLEVRAMQAQHLPTGGAA